MSTLFPFPEPTFLWVHTVTVHRRTGSTTDERGRVTATYAADALTGFLTAPDPQTVPDAGGLRERVSAVLLAPLSTTLDVADLIEGTDAALPAALQGKFRIELLRPNESHLRVLLSRWVVPWEASDGPD